MGKIKNFRNFFVIRVRWNIRNRIIQITYTLFLMAFLVYLVYSGLNDYNVPRGATTAFIILFVITGYGLFFIKFKDKPPMTKRIKPNKQNKNGQ